MDKKIKIDKNIPIPPRYKSEYDPYIETLLKLKNGESFEMDYSNNSECQQIRGRVSMFARKHKINIVTRAIHGKIRIWKVK